MACLHAKSISQSESQVRQRTDSPGVVLPIGKHDVGGSRDVESTVGDGHPVWAWLHSPFAPTEFSNALWVVGPCRANRNPMSYSVFRIAPLYPIGYNRTYAPMGPSTYVAITNSTILSYVAITPRLTLVPSTPKGPREPSILHCTHQVESGPSHSHSPPHLDPRTCRRRRSLARRASPAAALPCRTGRATSPRPARPRGR
jgi:hypothetical protein